MVSHEFGLVFEALSECLRTNNAELFTTSLVCATWLVYMLSLLPDTGVLGAARVCLLRQFVVVLRSAKHGSDRVLAMVALRSFMNDRGRFRLITYHFFFFFNSFSCDAHNIHLLNIISEPYL